MGARLPRAAEQERGKQEVRRRAQRPPADHRHLRQARLRLDRPRRPARPLPLVRAVHAAPARHRRRQDRHPRARGARRPLLHAPRPDRRRAAVRRAAAGHLRHLRPVRARHRRRHRPAEHPAALDRDRVGPGDLGGTGGRRPVHHRGLRRHAPGHHGLPARRARLRRADRRHAGDRRRQRPVHRRPGVLQPAAQVQDLDQRLRGAVHPPRDQRRRVRRGQAPADRRGRLRPVGRRRPVHQPDDRQAAWRLRPRRAGARGLGGGRQRLPRLRLPAAAAPGQDQVPHRGLGPGEVPRGAWRRSTSGTPSPTGPPR